MQWNLIRLRRENGMNQRDMSKLLDVSISTYQNKETGKSSFKDYEMFIISKHFKKSIEEIFLPTNCINSAIEA